MIRESMIVIKSRFFEDLGLIQISFYSFIYVFLLIRLTYVTIYTNLILCGHTETISGRTL